MLVQGINKKCVFLPRIFKIFRCYWLYRKCPDNWNTDCTLRSFACMNVSLVYAGDGLQSFCWSIGWSVGQSVCLYNFEFHFLCFFWCTCFSFFPGEISRYWVGGLEGVHSAPDSSCPDIFKQNKSSQQSTRLALRGGYRILSGVERSVSVSPPSWAGVSGGG